MCVDAAHTRDHVMRRIGARVGRAGDEVRRAAQAADEVLAEIRMIPDAGEHGRMQDLQHQRAEPTAEHAGEVGMDLPGCAVGSEQTGIAARQLVVDTARTARERARYPGAQREIDDGSHDRSVGARR